MAIQYFINSTDVSDYITGTSNIPIFGRNRNLSLIAEGFSFDLSINAPITPAEGDTIRVFVNSTCKYFGYISKSIRDYGEDIFLIEVNHWLYKWNDYKIDFKTLHHLLSPWNTGLTLNQEIKFDTQTGILPTPLDNITTYYVIPDGTERFQVTDEIDGDPISLTGGLGEWRYFTENLSSPVWSEGIPAEIDDNDRILKLVDPEFIGYTFADSSGLPSVAIGWLLDRLFFLIGANLDLSELEEDYYYSLEIAPGYLFSTSTGDDLIHRDSHGLVNDQILTFVPQTSGGVLPSPLTESTYYYVQVVDSNSFRVALSPGGGSYVNILTTGSGASRYFIYGEAPVSYTWDIVNDLKIDENMLYCIGQNTATNYLTIDAERDLFDNRMSVMDFMTWISSVFGLLIELTDDDPITFKITWELTSGYFIDDDDKYEYKTQTNEPQETGYKFSRRYNSNRQSYEVASQSDLTEYDVTEYGTEPKSLSIPNNFRVILRDKTEGAAPNAVLDVNLYEYPCDAEYMMLNEVTAIMSTWQVEEITTFIRASTSAVSSEYLDPEEDVSIIKQEQRLT